MDPEQTAPLSGFTVFASMIKLVWSASEYRKQTFFDKNYDPGNRIKNHLDSPHIWGLDNPDTLLNWSYIEKEADTLKITF